MCVCLLFSCRMLNFPSFSYVYVYIATNKYFLCLHIVFSWLKVLVSLAHGFTIAGFLHFSLEIWKHLGIITDYRAIIYSLVAELTVWTWWRKIRVLICMGVCVCWWEWKPCTSMCVLWVWVYEQEHLRVHYSSNFSEESFYVLVGNPLVLKVDLISPPNLLKFSFCLFC